MLLLFFSSSLGSLCLFIRSIWFGWRLRFRCKHFACQERPLDHKEATCGTCVMSMWTPWAVLGTRLGFRRRRSSGYRLLWPGLKPEAVKVWAKAFMAAQRQHWQWTTVKTQRPNALWSKLSGSLNFGDASSACAVTSACVCVWVSLHVWVCFVCVQMKPQLALIMVSSLSWLTLVAGTCRDGGHCPHSGTAWVGVVLSVCPTVCLSNCLCLFWLPLLATPMQLHLEKRVF